MSLKFTESGTGELALVFVHGIGGDRSHFLPQYRFFGRNCRTVGIDLPGHGHSGHPATGFTLQSFSDEIEELARSLKLERTMIVGHSLGGLLALNLGSRSLSWLTGVVILDTPIFVPPLAAAALAPYGKRFRSPEYPEAVREFVDRYFFSPHSEPSLRTRLLSQLGELPQSIFVKLWEEMGVFDAESASRRLRVPSLYIHSSVPADLPRLQEACPNTWIGRTVGSGHYLQLEVPNQVNTMIESFLLKRIPTPSSP